ncbi:MAG: hypothetical protein K2I87_01450 [Bacteroidales bacterium]|nr:hypothetical protein [Bacteroidales bacterium]
MPVCSDYTVCVETFGLKALSLHRFLKCEAL